MKRAIEEIKERYYGVPFIALGQTVFWDEPTKAVLKYWLDKIYPESKFILGVHNTDYFAKSPFLSNDEPYILVTHNDNSTKDLWASTVEISKPFGSENHPHIHFFTQCDVPLKTIAPKDRIDEFLDEITSSWGWMAIVKSGERSVVACDVKLKEIVDKIVELVYWGACGAKDLIQREDIRTFCEEIKDFILSYYKRYPEATVTDLYKELYLWFWKKLLGYEPKNTIFSSSLEIFRFNTETFHLPRFSIVEGFISPTTSNLYKDCYNRAISGSGIYTLDKFLYGAIPFDLVIPGKERGTICLQPKTLIIEGEEEIKVPLEKPITTIRELAEVVEKNFGKAVALVGKAVPLLSMIRKEFILVFNERGSSYYTYTFKMERLLKERGIELEFYPILRLRYYTWDNLGSILENELKLPGYMQIAFRKDKIKAGEFSNIWQDVVKEQNLFIEEISSIRKPRVIMKLLGRLKGNEWEERLTRYNLLKEEIIAKRKGIEKRWRELRELKERLRETKDYATRKELSYMVKRLTEETWQMEKNKEISSLREELHNLELEAERAKAELLRDSYLVKENLPYTNSRPSAWWFIAMDPTGNWFRKVAETVEFYTEGEENEVTVCKDASSGE
jgi:hypothetical protein